MARGARPFVLAEGQNMFSLSIIFFMLFPNGLVPSDEAFRTARNEKPLHGAN